MNFENQQFTQQPVEYPPSDLGNANKSSNNLSTY
jgi:hypothetical protein